MKRTFDYSKLRGRIREKFKTESAFGEAMGLSHNSISKKLNGKIMFVQNEIDKAIVLLEIPDDEISTYFFTPKVQDAEQLQSDWENGLRNGLRKCGGAR